MRARDIVGRKIIAIRQSHLKGRGLTMDALILDDGSEIVTCAHLSHGFPIGDLYHIKKTKPKPTTK